MVTIEDFWGKREGTEPTAASIIFADTIHAAYSDPNLKGKETVQECLTLLQGEQGDQVMQSIVEEYLGASHSGSFNLKMLRQDQNINVRDLKAELITQLTTHLNPKQG